MHLRRNNSRAVAESHQGFNDIGLYIRVIIDIYSASEVNREYWLTEREKEFYVATVVHITEGIDNPISDEAVQIYKKYFNPTTDKIKISDYLNRCRKKEWLKYDTGNRKVEIPQIFHNIDKNTDVMDFNLRYIYEKK